MNKDNFGFGVLSSQPVSLPVGATLMKTDQSISTASYDDGATKRGRLTDFFTLTDVNPFGVNTNRFTDKNGASVYSTKVAFDWSTYNNSTVLAYYFGDMGTARPWATQLSQYVGSTIDGLTGWYLTNFVEMVNIMNFALMGNYQLNYAPFSTILRYFWVSTQVAGSNGVATEPNHESPPTQPPAVILATSTNLNIWTVILVTSVNCNGRSREA